MTMKSNETFEEELTCQFKTNMRSLTNFGPSIENLKNLLFNRLLLDKAYNV